MSTNKIYCGSGKIKKFDNGGTINTITIDLDTIAQAFQEYGFTTQNGRNMIRLKVNSKREVDQYGKTHSVEIDTWKPQGATGPTGSFSVGQGKGSFNPGPEEDIPF